VRHGFHGGGSFHGGFGGRSVARGGFGRGGLGWGVPAIGAGVLGGYAVSNCYAWNGQTIRSALPDGRYHVGAALGAFDTVDCRIKAEIAGRGLITADLLVCADGAQSPTRRLLLPDATSDYAGIQSGDGRVANIGGFPAEPSAPGIEPLRRCTRIGEAR
jgi:hypothetical protein